MVVLAKGPRARDADRAIDAYPRPPRAGDNFFIRKEYGLYLLVRWPRTRRPEYWLRMANKLPPYDEQVNAGLAKLGVTGERLHRQSPAHSAYRSAAHQPP